MIQFTKGIIYPWKGSQGYSIGRTLSDNNPTRGLVVHNRADVSIGTQSEEVTMQGHWVIETTD